MAANYVKTDRSFSPYKKITWILVPLIALGGLYYPQMGLLVIGIMLSMMLLGLFKGKYWCGNLCPHGSLFDFILMRISIFKKIPLVFRSPILKWAFFVYFMTVFVIRLADAFGYWGEAVFLSQLGSVFVRQYLVWPTIVGVALALILNPRTWCSFCPMGTMQQVLYKAGKLLGINKYTDEFPAITDRERCSKCAKCARVCPVQLEPYKNWEHNRFQDENCIKCYTCVQNCPSQLLYSTKQHRESKNDVYAEKNFEPKSS